MVETYVLRVAGPSLSAMRGYASPLGEGSPVSAPELEAGRVVDGKYEVQGLLAHGGAIATYRAIAAPNEVVALKFYDPRLGSFPNVVNALARCETLANEL